MAIFGIPKMQTPVGKVPYLIHAHYKRLVVTSGQTAAEAFVRKYVGEHRRGGFFAAVGYGLKVLGQVIKATYRAAKKAAPYIIAGVSGFAAYKFVLAHPWLTAGALAASEYTGILDKVTDIPILRHVRTGVYLGAAAASYKLWRARHYGKAIGPYVPKYGLKLAK